jgi:hypothetical protein
MGWPQQMSWPWPGLVTMNSEPHLVQKYRFPTWFAMVYHPRKVYRRSSDAVNIGMMPAAHPAVPVITKKSLCCPPTRP